MKSPSCFVFVIVVLLFVVVGQQQQQQLASAYQPAPKVDGNNSKYSQAYGNSAQHNNKSKKPYYSRDSTDHTSNYNESADIDNRIQISEPYKTLIQTSTRLALTQSGASKHVDVDMAMDLLSDTSYMLSKPSTLSKFFKTITVLLASLMTSVFLFPGAYKFAESAWRDPHQVVKLVEFSGRYLPNGINERTIVNLLGNSGASEFLANIGLTDSACREQSICQMGELLKCTFPQSSEFLIHFVEVHFSRPRYRENKYVNAFLLGFVEQNCAPSLNNSVENNDTKPARSGKSCFGNLVGSYLLSKCPTRRDSSSSASSSSSSSSSSYSESSPSVSSGKQKVEYQTIQAGRA